MEAHSSAGETPPALDVTVVQRFVRTLFAPEDVVLVRPIETWEEAGRKQARTLFKATRYLQAVSASAEELIWRELGRVAQTEHANLFFGVCPRVGSAGQFDLAWQIRTVRTLWADVDRTSVAAALARVAQAGLPEPSLVVNSGHGAHLYWLLETPYLIEDAGAPPPIHTQWVESPNGRKKPRRYVLEEGDPVYLDRRRDLLRLSPQAQHVQDVLAGLAHAIGGDHATDLARLLRLPGTLNRKNERNGSPPQPAVLVQCEAERRYPWSAFERLADSAPTSQRARQIASMPLPQPRRLSPSKSDRLARLIAASAIAEPGRRSEPDFAVCCYAARQGLSSEELWQRVAQVGKFAEQGERYFERTWASAVWEVQCCTYEQIQQQRTDAAPAPLPTRTSEPLRDDQAPGPEEAVPGDVPPVDVQLITIAPAHTPVGTTLGQITDCLLASGICFERAAQLVAVRDEHLATILAPPELAGLLNEYVEFYLLDGDAGEYRPLPPAYASTWLHQHAERNRLRKITLFSRNPVYAPDWRLVAPGFDAPSGIYYAGPAVEARNGTAHLDALLQDFCFRARADRTNYLGVLLTALLMPRFIGSKPAVLFNGNQPGLGKSILAQLIAILRDGQPTETATYNPNDEEFEKRLGAIVRRGATTIVVDNAKSRGHSPRIDSACLERSITDPIVSFRLLGHSDSIRAENSHLFCLTANAPDISPDLVTRSVVINLYFEGDPARRRFTIPDPEAYALAHRGELLGELIGMVERWRTAGQPRASVPTRFNKRGWGDLVGGILQANGQPDFLANAEEAAGQLDETRREFLELIDCLAESPQGVWTAADLVELCSKHQLLRVALGDGSARSQATRLGVLVGRFVAERFTLADGRTAVFQRTEERNGNRYRLGID